MTIQNRITTAICSFAIACASLFASAPAFAALGEPGEDEDTTEVSEVAKPIGLEGQVNINTASAAELELLPGIGPSIAARIVSYRGEHPFQQLNHIMRVKGVGKKTYAKIKPFLTLEGNTTLRSTK